MRIWIAALPLLLAACLPERDRPTGRADYATFCAACHGASGAGDGTLATDLIARPADLTRLSARNGGTFPKTAVMAKIWGYAEGTGHGEAVMPQFSALLDSDLVPYDGGDGIATPTPLRLVQVSEYLESLQR
ncbi:c-type cytochrome [Pseudogemmobacter sonorensis]|uniref:c-type cytochrome n=1 Tax=Pseudogemmobacter sonorensis TaxID=2989681 RepID=UPI00368701D8